jgi:CDP-glucose 4,6-dehydratase
VAALVRPSSSFWKGKRVFVTGHTGFKGTWLAFWLLRLGAIPFGYALPPVGSPNLWTLTDAGSQIEGVFGDVRDKSAIADALQRSAPDIVFHLAAQSLVRQSYRDPVGTFETNVNGTVNVLEAVRRTSTVRAVVVVTSDKCYENRGVPWPYKESEPLGGHDPYSASKACAEVVTAAWRRSFFAIERQPGLAGVASARAGNVIGGGDWAEDRLVPDFVRAVTAGEKLLVRNSHSTRPWQHVLEPLCGYLLLAECLWRDPLTYAESWNFGPDEADVKPVAWLADRMTALWGPCPGWSEVPPAGDRHEAAFLSLDSAKARSRIGWRPRLGLEGALEWTIHWYRRQHAGEGARDLLGEQLDRFEQL